VGLDAVVTAASGFPLARINEVRVNFLVRLIAEDDEDDGAALAEEIDGFVGEVGVVSAITPALPPDGDTIVTSEVSDLGIAEWMIE
jgi:hypothetical protein